MFAGHLGAGLMLKRAARSANLGTLFFAAMLLDVVLWVLVLGGVESVRPKADFRTMVDLAYDFPWSHSLAAAAAWSISGWAIGYAAWRHQPGHGLRSSFVIAAAVFSHFALDWLVHVPELPILGNSSTKLGAGLWQHLPMAWTVETLLAAAGLWCFLSTTRPARRKTVAIIVVMALVTVMTIGGQASKSPPPAPMVMAVSSLVTIGVLVGFGAWVDHRLGK